MSELRHNGFSDTELGELRREITALGEENQRLRDDAAIQTLQVDELSHRLKNTIAAVQSIASHTWSTAQPAEFPGAFAGRLRAYERSQGLLRDGDLPSDDLAGIFRFELTPYDNPRVSRVSLEGPDVILTRRAAAALAMAAHELATNAAKYGALSVVAGRLEVSWTITGHEGGPRLHLAWVERGGPKVSPPTRRGFGTRLLEEALAGELHGDVTLSFPPEGVRCSMDLPLATYRVAGSYTSPGASALIDKA